MVASFAESLVKQGLFSINVALDPTFITIPDNDSQQSIDEKPANAWFRWNLAWFVFFCLIFIPLPFWLYPLTCLGGYLASVIVTLWMGAVLLACMINASYTMFRMYRNRHRTWLNDNPAAEVGRY
jgi:predicted membrane channel-forming protein YqfA (hemolysin III family)